MLAPEQIINSRIPTRIIQTNKSLDLPLLERAAVANVRLLNPDFEYLFFDDRQVEEFVEKEFPEYRRVFHSFPVPIQRYDFFRYLAVYRYGGFYLDMDVFLASSLSDLLDYGCVFPFEALTINAYLRKEHKMDWEVGNYAFGAAPGHPFLRAIIENCIRAQKDWEWQKNMGRSIPRIFREEYYALYTTGPLLVSRTLAEFPDAEKWVKVLFPEDVCDMTYWNRFGKFGVHLMGGSWRKRKGILRRRLQGYWELFMLNKMAKESRKMGKSRSLKFI
jgi:hypothetical protein